MASSCPLSFKPVESNTSRISSLLVVTLVVLYLFTSNIYILIFLALDFVIKLFSLKLKSPIYLLAKLLKNSLKIEDKFIDGGAKRLAGFFGLLFVVLLILAHFIGIWNLSLGIATIFMFCSLLDLFFNYCIGCKIYFIVKKIYPNFMNDL